MTPPINVLFIENNPDDAQFVIEELKGMHSRAATQLVWVDNLRTGLERLTSTEDISAVLVALFLPDSQGLDTLRSILACAPQIPVIVMTSVADEETGVKAVQAGAQDHLIKGEVDGRLLVRVIQYAIQRKQAELDLRASEEKIQNIIQHSSSVFYTHTPDNVLTFVSPQARTILDCEPGEARVRWHEFPTDHPSNQQDIESTERAIQTGQRQPPYELELRTFRGRKIWVLVDESPVVRNGVTVSIVGSLTRSGMARAIRWA